LDEKDTMELELGFSTCEFDGGEDREPKFEPEAIPNVLEKTGDDTIELKPELTTCELENFEDIGLELE
jgi:hypothetical protein